MEKISKLIRCAAKRWAEKRRNTDSPEQKTVKTQAEKATEKQPETADHTVNKKPEVKQDSRRRLISHSANATGKHVISQKESTYKHTENSIPRQNMFKSSG